MTRTSRSPPIVPYKVEVDVTPGQGPAARPPNRTSPSFVPRQSLPTPPPTPSEARVDLSSSVSLGLPLVPYLKPDLTPEHIPSSRLLDSLLSKSRFSISQSVVPYKRSAATDVDLVSPIQLMNDTSNTHPLKKVKRQFSPLLIACTDLPSPRLDHRLTLQTLYPSVNAHTRQIALEHDLPSPPASSTTPIGLSLELDISNAICEPTPTIRQDRPDSRRLDSEASGTVGLSHDGTFPPNVIEARTITQNIFMTSDINITIIEE